MAGAQLDVWYRDGHHEVIGGAGATGGGADPMAFTHDWHQAVIEDFARSLRDDTRPMVTGAEALQVHALIEALKRSAQEKCEVEVQDV